MIFSGAEITDQSFTFTYQNLRLMVLKNMMQFCSTLHGKDNFCKKFFFFFFFYSSTLFPFFISWYTSECLTETWVTWATSEVAGTVVLLCASWVISDTNREWVVTGEEFAQWLPVLWVYYTNCWLLHSCVKWTLINPAVKVLLHLLKLAHYEKCKQLSQSTLCAY